MQCSSAFTSGNCGSTKSPDGGIGRRAGLKHQWGKTRAGSRPALGTGKGGFRTSLFLYPPPGPNPFLFLVRHSEQGGPPGPLSLAYSLRPNTLSKFMRGTNCPPHEPIILLASLLLLGRVVLLVIVCGQLPFRVIPHCDLFVFQSLHGLFLRLQPLLGLRQH